MERDLRPAASGDSQKIELDIRKILEQMGFNQETWPPEWREPAKKQ